MSENADVTSIQKDDRVFFFLGLLLHMRICHIRALTKSCCLWTLKVLVLEDPSFNAKKSFDVKMSSNIYGDMTISE